ncbi:MAG: hypothetical protein LBH94_01195 [Deltaproteobacteria bacterium]|nr:hypothetical protein [Deltaproteobacteria bacterium]
MKIVGEYSFNDGKEAVQRDYQQLFMEIRAIIESVDAHACKTKESKEKTMPGQMLFSPTELNQKFKDLFYGRAWESVRVTCDYPTKYYVKNYKAKPALAQFTRAGNAGTDVSRRICAIQSARLT